jgi:hypothetical protein
MKNEHVHDEKGCEDQILHPLIESLKNAYHSKKDKFVFIAYEKEENMVMAQLVKTSQKRIYSFVRCILEEAGIDLKEAGKIIAKLPPTKKQSK